MATASLTTTPTTIAAASDGSVYVTNTGASRVTIVNGTETTYVRRGRSTNIVPTAAVTARVLASDGGSGSISYDVAPVNTGADLVRVNELAPGAGGGVTGNGGSALSTATAIAADPAFTGTYAAVAVPALDTSPGADNTAAILAARTAAISRGVPLWIPPGTWKMSDVPTGWNGGRVLAHGATLDIQTDHSSTGRGFYATAIDDFQIHGLTLAQSNATARNGVYGMFSFLASGGVGCSNIVLRDVRVTGGESAVIYSERLTDFLLDGIAGSGVWSDGIHLARGTLRGIVRGARIRNVKDDAIALVGITSESGGAVTYPQMSDITISGAMVSGITVAGSGIAVVGAKDITVSGATIKSAYANGVNVQSSPGIGAPTPSVVAVSGVVVDGTTTGHGFLVGASTDVTLTGCSATACGDSGVALLGSTRTLVSGGSFRANTGFGLYESSGTNNNVNGAVLTGNTAGTHQIGSATLTGCVTA